MTAEEYAEAQEGLVIVAAMVRNLPLEEMLRAIARAETVAPILDPTLFLRAGAKMAQVKQLAEALLPVKREIERQLAVADRRPLPTDSARRK